MKAENVAAPSEAPAQDWAEVAAQLDAGEFMSLDNDGPPNYTTWLATIDADGSPHVTAVGAVWDGDAFWFQTGDGTRKAQNIARDPRCALSVGLAAADVVVEGTAEKVTDPGAVARIAAIWSGRGSWPATPDESGTGITAPFNAPGLGPPPWFVYRITPAVATAVTKTGASTRWTF
jgi:PPOX class probable F420-dependent enzyme